MELAADGILDQGELLEDLADAEWVREDSTRTAEMLSDCLANKVIALLALGRLPAALTEAERARLARLEGGGDRAA